MKFVARLWETHVMRINALGKVGTAEGLEASKHILCSHAPPGSAS